MQHCAGGAVSPRSESFQHDNRFMPAKCNLANLSFGAKTKYGGPSGQCTRASARSTPQEALAAAARGNRNDWPHRLGNAAYTNLGCGVHAAFALSSPCHRSGRAEDAKRALAARADQKANKTLCMQHRRRLQMPNRRPRRRPRRPHGHPLNPCRLRKMTLRTATTTTTNMHGGAWSRATHRPMGTLSVGRAVCEGRWRRPRGC